MSKVSELTVGKHEITNITEQKPGNYLVKLANRSGSFRLKALKNPLSPIVFSTTKWAEVGKYQNNLKIIAFYDANDSKIWTSKEGHAEVELNENVQFTNYEIKSDAGPITEPSSIATSPTLPAPASPQPVDELSSLLASLTSAAPIPQAPPVAASKIGFLTNFEVPRIWPDLTPQEILLKKDIKEFVDLILASSDNRLSYDILEKRDVLRVNMVQQDIDFINSIFANRINLVQGKLTEKAFADYCNAVFSAVGNPFRINIDMNNYGPGPGDGGSDMSIGGTFFDVKSRKINSKHDRSGLVLKPNFNWSKPTPKLIVPTAIQNDKVVYLISYVVEQEYKDKATHQPRVSTGPVLDVVDMSRNIFDLTKLILLLGIKQKASK